MSLQWPDCNNTNVIVHVTLLSVTLSFLFLWRAVAQWVKHQTHSGDSVCGCCYENLAIFFTLRCSSSLSCMNEYLAIESGRYFWPNNLCAVIATWLNASQRSWYLIDWAGLPGSRMWSVLSNPLSLSGLKYGQVPWPLWSYHQRIK